jgi:hypothetical protein
MKHPTEIPGFDGSMEELADHVADLRYDALHQFLDALWRRLDMDHLADEQRCRKKLSDRLYAASVGVASASMAISDAWEICEPHETID